jgi:hypothetical protein
MVNKTIIRFTLPDTRIPESSSYNHRHEYRAREEQYDQIYKKTVFILKPKTKNKKKCK